jgi:ankyrin repeat protein
MLACDRGREGLVSFLLKKGASIALARTTDQASALHVASAGGHDGCVKLLLSYHEKNPHMPNFIDVLDKNHATPIMFATRADSLKTIQLLLKGKADLSKQVREAVRYEFGCEVCSL